MSRCRGCGQPVEWARFESGKKAPFDVDPDVGGLRWVLEEDLGVMWARKAARDEKGVTCHFDTCDVAEQFRGEKARR